MSKRTKRARHNHDRATEQGANRSAARTAAPSAEEVAIQIAAAVVDQIAAIGDGDRATVVPEGGTSDRASMHSAP